MFSSTSAAAAGLQEVRERGVLRHVGAVDSGFVRADGTGLDVDLMRRFAEHLAVDYEFVASPPGDLKKSLLLGGASGGGDVASGGLFSGSLGEGVVYSSATFPTQVWLMVKSEDPLKPMAPIGNPKGEINRSRSLLKDRKTLCPATGWAAAVGQALRKEGFAVTTKAGSLDELVALAETKNMLLIIDAPSALLVLSRWKDKMKYLGPLSEQKNVVLAFRKGDDDLRQAFESFYSSQWASWDYARMAKSSFPPVLNYFLSFFVRGHSGERPSWVKPDPAYFPK